MELRGFGLLTLRVTVVVRVVCARWGVTAVRFGDGEAPCVGAAVPPLSGGRPMSLLCVFPVSSFTDVPTRLPPGDAEGVVERRGVVDVVVLPVALPFETRPPSLPLVLLLLLGGPSPPGGEVVVGADSLALLSPLTATL